MELWTRVSRAFARVLRVSSCYLNLCHLYAGLQPHNYVLLIMNAHNSFIDNNNNNNNNGVDVGCKYTMASLLEVSGIIMITTQSTITTVNAEATNVNKQTVTTI